MSVYNQENIVALATPPGLGALAIVRISGKKLSDLYTIISHKKPKDRFALYTKIYHPKTKNILDEGVITYFKAPKSYTGEDIIEISCHGGNYIHRKITQAIIDSGARIADPGEFSLRAFLNGKIDLLQAEGIAALISSKASIPAEISLNHLSGHVSQTINNIKNQAINLLSVIENELNFSEDEINITSYNDIRNEVTKIQKQIISILSTSTYGKNIFFGIKIIIIGRANSGKSSLFNAILGYDRSIVSNQPGTTRDTIEAWIELNGLPVCLVDTAGIWESKEFLDNIGLKKTFNELESADLCIIVDENSPSSFLKSDFLKNIKSDVILVKSKCDNISSLSTVNNIHSLSSKKNIGIDKLLTHISTYIVDNFNGNDINNQMIISNRQRNLLESAENNINDILNQIDACMEIDIIASTLMGLVVSLKDIIGEIPSKEVLNNIFSKFCIGK